MTSKLSPFQLSLGRRTLLRNLGFATAGALTGSAWERAQAAEKRPTRIIFFYTENGTLQSSWRPGPIAGKSEATENEWALGEMHGSILKDYKQDLIYIENVDLISTDLDLSLGSGSHERMQTHMLSGHNRAGVNLGGAMTIDQYIAKEINSPQAQTAFRSLEYCAVGYGGHHYVSWSGPGQLLEPEYTPYKAYDRLFKEFKAPQTGDAAVQAAAKAARKRKLMYDTLKAEFSSVQAGLSNHSKAKIEAHASSIRDLESRLNLTKSATCSPPSRDAALAVDGLERQTGGYERREYWDKSSETFMQMATAALACDLTRVVTIELGNPPEPITGWPGDIHVGPVHGVHSENSLEELRAMPGYAELMKYHRWYAQQFANLIRMLKAIPEGEPGQTLFDHTVIYWFTPMGQGNHDPHQMPYVLAGGANGYFRTGRYIKFNRRPATAEEKAIDKIETEDKALTPATRGVPHNNLLVSLVNAMGIPITTYGNPKCCTGPLEGLR